MPVMDGVGWACSEEFASFRSVRTASVQRGGKEVGRGWEVGGGGAGGGEGGSGVEGVFDCSTRPEANCLVVLHSKVSHMRYLDIPIGVVVKIMVPCWVPIIIRGLIRGLIQGTQKGTIMLTIPH